MVTKREAGALVASSAVGTAQTPLLREYVDKKYPTKRIVALKGFGTPSSLTGTVGGGFLTLAGVYSVMTGKGIRDLATQAAAMGYGVPALVGGVLSGVFPAIPVEAAGMGVLRRVTREPIVTPTGARKYRSIA